VNPILHSNILGTGKPLLVLHGVFGMSDNWISFANVFANNFEVHLIDLRNHGRSFHADDFTYDLMATDVYRYILHHDIQNFHLLGHSLGGKVAMTFVDKYPHFIDKLVVVDIAPKAYPVHHQGIINALKSVDFKIVKTRIEVEEILLKSIQDKSVIQFLLKNLYWKTKDDLAFRLNIDAIDKNIEHIVMANKIDDQIEQKTLFIKGENSNYILESDIKMIEAMFSDVVIETIKNAGHWVHAENSTDFNSSVLNFLLLNNNF
jgi:pimeloyl-ACP methyl ester carboxylesterase